MTDSELIQYLTIMKKLKNLEKYSNGQTKMLNKLVRKSKYSFIEDVGANLVGDAIFGGLVGIIKKIR